MAFGFENSVKIRRLNHAVDGLRYAPRARLFRTPNDAAMTQQPADPRRLLRSLAPVPDKRMSEQQESALSAMSGSFHPTFEAHATKGWAVGDELIEALPAPQ